MELYCHRKLDHCLKQDCGIIFTYLKGVSDPHQFRYWVVSQRFFCILLSFGNCVSAVNVHWNGAAVFFALDDGFVKEPVGDGLLVLIDIANR